MMRANDHVAARRHSTWPVRNPRADWLRRNGRGVAADPERLARFRREAQVLASLNHPNIAHVYGLEEATASTAGGQAVHALVMELVEGEDLADRIARGPVPLDETLPIARQIADALEAAHEQGIIHRDLKPANIKVRDDGTVKVLDFGLAKALDPAGDAVSTRRHAPIADSPTITSPVMTQMGVLLGTAAYMSPEQAKCKPADKRSDLWAFGCVLYEMLTGKPAFAGEDLSETLAAVLRAAPDWSRLPPLPASLHALLQRCLEKDRQKRVADISTARFVFAEPSLINDHKPRSLVARPSTSSVRPGRCSALGRGRHRDSLAVRYQFPSTGRHNAQHHFRSR
jgi:eukaryotic-like serine/threonine-protein kinase